MARRNSSTIQEELYSTPDEPAREELDDARLLDLDAEKESPFLRAQKRIPARRSALPKKTTTRILWSSAAVVVVVFGALAASAFYRYGEHSWRFRLNSSDDIEMSGLGNVSRTQVMEVMGGDIGRNIFYIPLDQRQKQLEQIPWVESASVMRFTPNRIRIEIHERTPVAFARVGSKILLVDTSGALMEISAHKKYSFPVVTGINAGEPLSARAAKMKIYSDLVRDLDAGGAHYSQDLSEVDLSDAEDVKTLTNDPEGAVLVHLGSSNYLDRFKIYITHLREWRQQFQKIESVDLRYDQQIIVNPDLPGTARQQPVSLVSAKAAIAAGVKPAVLASPIPTKAPVHAKVVKSLSPKTVKRPVQAQKPPRWHRKTVAAKHADAKRPVTNASLTTKTTTASQKPSPAIVRGEESR